MSVWPAEATCGLDGPPEPSAEERGGDGFESRLALAYRTLRRMDERLWGATPMRRGLRIDCWISRREPAHGIMAVEDLGRLYGLCWSLPEAGEVGVPTHLGDDHTLRRQLELLWSSRAGWMIVEGGQDLDWYVQVLLDDHDPMAEVEAVAGRHAPSRLLSRQRRALLRHGFAVPSDGEFRNAHRRQGLGCSSARAHLAETIQQVMHEVYGCEEHHPVVMRLGR